MSARLFISYRTADGTGTALALARELGRAFGDELVFLDLQGPRGGAAWREAMAGALGERPVLLLLMTPQLVEVPGPDGRLRIADPADPVRREFELAMEAGAHVIPVLCDGLSRAPEASKLPEPFHRIGGLTWRKLREAQWAQDVAQLVGTLKALGVTARRARAPAAPPPAAHAAARPAGRSAATRRAPATPLRPYAPTLIAAVAALAALAGGFSAVMWHRGNAFEAMLLADPPSAGIVGPWVARLAADERVAVVIAQAGDRVTLASEPVSIEARPDWAAYRKVWRQRFGTDLNAVTYRGEGRLVSDPGVPPKLDIALRIHPSPDRGEAIDRGNLGATLSPDGRTFTGTLRLESRQADEPAALSRTSP